VPELIDHGRTGFVGETNDELAAWCREVEGIDRRACRAEALRRFSPATMTDGYEAVYRRLLDAPNGRVAPREMAALGAGRS
jgi:hypothetical protein